MTTADHDRHLSWPNLLTYLEAGAPAAVPIGGSADLSLIIEPAKNRVAVRGPWPVGSDVPNLDTYRHIGIQAGTDASVDWVEFSVTGRSILREAYPLLVAVADYVQLEGADMGLAIGRAIASHQEVLSALGRLSDHQELGLHGELLVLDHLIGSIGEHDAIRSWRGPTGGEHDFTLGASDLEVKTTLSEERSHRISSLTQLEPSSGRALWLVSVQLTTTGTSGKTLSELIAHTMDRFSDLSNRKLYSDRLSTVGWDSGLAHLYTRRYTYRGKTLTFEINSDFPTITASRLHSSGFAIERFSNVTYILHTMGLPSEPPPVELTGI